MSAGHYANSVHLHKDSVRAALNKVHDNKALHYLMQMLLASELTSLNFTCNQEYSVLSLSLVDFTTKFKKNYFD